MSNRDKFLDKFPKEIVYFKNTFEGAVIKSIPEEGMFVRFPGKEPFKAEKGSALITEAILEGNEITKEEYNNF